MECYLLMDDPDAYAAMVGEITREKLIDAARTLAHHPMQLAVAPGRVGRNVEHVLLNLVDVEEDFS
jgi:hypothetical protein